MARITNGWTRLLSILAILSAVCRTLAVVTGATGTNGTRLEIRKLVQSEAQWNMFILGLSAMQNVTQSNNDSYYTIGGKLSPILSLSARLTSPFKQFMASRNNYTTA